MTKREAELALQQGHRVTNTLFSLFNDNEHIYMEDNILYTEENLAIGTIDDDIWKNLLSFEEGWEIWK